MGIIYKHTSPSGRSYIGQTIRTMGYRLNGHIRNACTGGNTKFAFAIRKYGIDSFTSEVLIEVENCKLNEQEIFS